MSAIAAPEADLRNVDAFFIFDVRYRHECRLTSVAVHRLLTSAGI